MDSNRLFLKATDEESCDLISALLQDSIFHISALSFHEERQCLRLMTNRFCWELVDYNNSRKKEKGYFRVHSGLYIHNIQHIEISTNFEKAKREKYLNLLAMHYSDGEISMLFSGYKRVYIKTNKLSVYFKDLHDKYPTASIPQHECLQPEV